MRNEIDRANELYVLALRQQSGITFHTFFSYNDDNNTSNDILRLNESIEITNAFLIVH